MEIVGLIGLVGRSGEVHSTLCHKNTITLYYSYLIYVILGADAIDAIHMPWRS